MNAITPENFERAFETIRQYCNKQTACSKCPAVKICLCIDNSPPGDWDTPDKTPDASEDTP